MRTVFWVGFWTFLADQASKYLVVHWLNLRELSEIVAVPGLVNLRMAWNYGVNFGLFAENSELTRWVLIAVALVISGAVLWWTHHEEDSLPARIAAGLLVGGALGNVVDRISTVQWPIFSMSPAAASIIPIRSTSPISPSSPGRLAW